MVQTLLDLGADPAMVNSKGMHAYQAYADNFSTDEGSVLIEQAIYFKKDSKSTQIQDMFTPTTQKQTVGEILSTSIFA